jgi:hypothetical protein
MRSLINPFSPLRHLDLWSIAAFGSSGHGGGTTLIPFNDEEIHEGALGVVAGDYTVESFLETEFAEMGGWTPETCPMFDNLSFMDEWGASDYVPAVTSIMNDTLDRGEGRITDDMMFNNEDVMDTADTAPPAADATPVNDEVDTGFPVGSDGGLAAVGKALTDAPTTDGRGEAKPDPVAEKVQQTMDEATVQGASPSETGDDRGSRTDEVRPGPDDDQDQDDQTAEVPASVDP